MLLVRAVTPRARSATYSIGVPSPPSVRQALDVASRSAGNVAGGRAFFRAASDAGSGQGERSLKESTTSAAHRPKEFATNQKQMCGARPKKTVGRVVWAPAGGRSGRRAVVLTVGRSDCQTVGRAVGHAAGRTAGRSVYCTVGRWDAGGLENSILAARTTLPDIDEVRTRSARVVHFGAAKFGLGCPNLGNLGQRFGECWAPFDHTWPDSIEFGLDSGKGWVRSKSARVDHVCVGSGRPKLFLP